MAKNDKKGTVGQTSDPVKKPHTMEEIVPSSIPLTIPYFEVYRTNELEYVEYQSPYLSQESEESGGGSESGLDEETSEEISAKKQKLSDSIRQLLDTYYPKLQNKDYYVKELTDEEISWTPIARIVNKMGNPSSRTQNFIIEQVLQLKEKTFGVTRRTYSQSKKLVKVIGKAGSTQKGRVVITAMSNSKIQLGQGRTSNDIVLNTIGKKLDTITKISNKTK